jgi:hypothetical protein
VGISASNRDCEHSEGQGDRSDFGQHPRSSDRVALDSQDGQRREGDCLGWTVSPQEPDETGSDPRRQLDILQADNLDALKLSIIQTD